MKILIIYCFHVCRGRQYKNVSKMGHNVKSLRTCGLDTNNNCIGSSATTW